MSRIAAGVNCTADDKKELERLSKSRTDEVCLVERAKIVLGCLAGRRNEKNGVRHDYAHISTSDWSQHIPHPVDRWTEEK